jgi:hypothetical protein
MSIDTISPLRQRMIEDMNARKLCAATQTGHIRSCKRFAAFLKRSPDTATLEDIRRFQLHLAETAVSICNRNRIMTGLRFLFRVTLRRLDLAAEIYHIREPQKIPLVMSPDETKRLLAVASSLKARILLSLSYGCGLRAGEVVRLKVKHIDSAQKIIRIEQSKSRKDRHVMLSPETLDLLRQWWKARRGFDTTTPVQECWLSRPQARQANDHSPTEPPVPRGGGRGRDQEKGIRFDEHLQLWEIAEQNLDAAVEQRQQEFGVVCQPVKLRDHQLGLTLLAGGQRLGEFWPRLASAALNFSEGCDRLPAAAVEVVAHSLALSVETEAAVALARRRNAKVLHKPSVVRDHDRPPKTVISHSLETHLGQKRH